MTALPDFDPPANERVFYRHRGTGDRGWLVHREGGEAVKYDRPMMDQYSTNLGDWEKEAINLPRYTPIQVAKVCFEADKALCWANGEMKLAKREWVGLTESARKKWMEDGPSDPVRRVVYDAIQSVMKAAK